MFLRIRSASEGQAERVVDASLVGGGTGNRPLGHFSRSFVDKRAVHHVKGLRGNGGHIPLADHELWIGHVKNAEELRHHAANQRQVGAAESNLFFQAIGLGPAANFAIQLLRERAGGTLQIEFAADGQHAVANRFRVEAAAAHPPQILVVRIDGVTRFAVLAGKLVRATEDDLANELFHAPALLAEAIGQVIEQLGMGRWLAERSKVIDRPHNPAAEQVIPNTVGHHAGGEWISFVRHPDRQLQPPALAHVDVRGLRHGQDGDVSALDLRPQVLHLAANIHAAIHQPAGVLDPHDRRALGNDLLFQCFNFSLQIGNQGFLAGIGGSNTLQSRPFRFPLLLIPFFGIGDDVLRLGKRDLRLFQFSLELRQVAAVIGVRGRLFGKIDERHKFATVSGFVVSRFNAGKHLGAAKDPGQSVIIGCGNRVELVIVAAGTGHAQPHHSPRGDINLLVGHVHRILLAVSLIQPLHPNCEKAGRRDVLVFLRIVLGRQQIAGNLLADELVVGFVGRKRVKDVVAVSPGIGIRNIPLLSR